MTEKKTKKTKGAECKLPEGYLNVGNTVIIIEKEDPYKEFLDHIKRNGNTNYLRNISRES